MINVSLDFKPFVNKPITLYCPVKSRLSYFHTVM